MRIPFILIVAVAFAQSVFGEEVIASLPFVVSQSGTYRVASDLVFAGQEACAITIAADDVVLELSGRSIRLGSSANSSATGICGVNRKRVTVQNGSVVGFAVGVSLNSYDDSAGPIGRPPSELGGLYCIRNVVVEGSVKAGIVVSGYASEVMRNRVVRCGQSAPVGLGISVAGTGSVVDGNQVLASGSPTDGRALSVESADGAVVRRNVIVGFNVDNPLATSSPQLGVLVLHSKSIAFIENVVSRFNTGVSAVDSSGVQTGNIFSGVAVSVKGALKRGLSVETR